MARFQQIHTAGQTDRFENTDTALQLTAASNLDGSPRGALQSR